MIKKPLIPFKTFRNFLVRKYAYRVRTYNEIQSMDTVSARNGLVLSFFVFFLLFVVDALFAISLQRFLSSIGLIQQLGATRFLGELGSPAQESATLLSLTLLRFCSLVSSNYATAFTVSKFQYSSRLKLLQKDFRYKNDDEFKGKFQYYFNDVSNVMGDWLGSTYQLFGKLIISLGLFLILFHYSPILTVVLLALCFVLLPFQIFLSERIKKFSIQQHKIKEDLSSDFVKALSPSIEGVKSEILWQQNSIEKLRTLGISQRKSSVYYSIRNQIPYFIGVFFVVIVSYGHKSLFGDNPSEVVPYLYLMLRLAQSLSDVTRLSSYLRIDWPRVQSFLKIVHE